MLLTTIKINSKLHQLVLEHQHPSPTSLLKLKNLKIQPGLAIAMWGYKVGNKMMESFITPRELAT